MVLSKASIVAKEKVEFLLLLFCAGEVTEATMDGGHAGPSCATWSRVRFQPGGPPPLRLRAHLRGRPGIRRGHAQWRFNRRMLRADGVNWGRR